MRSYIVALALTLAACQGTSGTVSPNVTPDLPLPAAKHSGPFPPACTVRQVKSGQKVTSFTAFGNVVKNKFALVQPSSWMQVEWLSVPPPGSRPHGVEAGAPRIAAGYYLYYGTYQLTDKTQGCAYVVTTIDGKPLNVAGNAAVTAMPRIPDGGATLPSDFGMVATLALTFKSDGTGSGTVLLTHNGSATAVMTGTLKIVGRITLSL